MLMVRPREKRDAQDRIIPLLEKTAAALDAGRPEEALTLAEEILALSPDSGPALQYRAAAQLELGQVENAAKSYTRALEVAPDDLEIVLGAAELFICHQGEDRASVEEGLALCARGRRQAARRRDAE